LKITNSCKPLHRFVPGGGKNENKKKKKREKTKTFAVSWHWLMSLNTNISRFVRCVHVLLLLCVLGFFLIFFIASLLRKGNCYQSIHLGICIFYQRKLWDTAKLANYGVSLFFSWEKILGYFIFP